VKQEDSGGEAALSMSVGYLTVSSECRGIVVNAPISFASAALTCLVNVEPDESCQPVSNEARGELPEGTGLPGGRASGSLADQHGLASDTAHGREGLSEDGAEGVMRGLEVAVDADLVNVPTARPQSSDRTAAMVSSVDDSYPRHIAVARTAEQRYDMLPRGYLGSRADVRIAP
jgi:hypothetical protein